MEILLRVFPCLVDGVWSLEDDKERKISVFAGALVVAVHCEADSLHGEWAAHNWLECGCVVIKLVDLEAWADLGFCAYLSKAKWCIKVNCGSTTGKSKGV